MCQSQEDNAHVEEQFRKEIAAQSKLAELYKVKHPYIISDDLIMFLLLLELM